MSTSDESGDAPPPPSGGGEAGESEGRALGAGVGIQRWAKDPALAQAEKPQASNFELTPAGEWLRVPLMVVLSLVLPVFLASEGAPRLLGSIYAVGVLAGFAFTLAPRRGWSRELAAGAAVLALFLAACGWVLGVDFLVSLREGGEASELWLAACRRLYTEVRFPNDHRDVHLPVILVACLAAEIVIREGVTQREAEAPLWGLVIPALALQIGWFLLLPGQASLGEWAGFLVSVGIFSSVGLVAGALGGLLVACLIHGLVQRLRSAF